MRKITFLLAGTMLASTYFQLTPAFAITGVTDVPVEEVTEDPVTEPPVDDVVDEDPVDEDPPVIIPLRDGPPEEKDWPQKEVIKKPPQKLPKYDPDPKVYRVPTTANYCPKGLQPVTLDGSISCGQPTARHSYPQVMKHPGVKRRSAAPRVYERSARPRCLAGVKGCSDY